MAMLAMATRLVDGRAASAVTNAVDIVKKRTRRGSKTPVAQKVRVTSLNAKNAKADMAEIQP
jgi:hypothetical protein